MSNPIPPSRGAGRRGWVFAALATVFAITPAFFWSGTLLAEEVAGLLRKNWAPRSFLQRTFDPRGWDFYQGRELSYAIDCLDAQWLRWLIAHDRLWLVPPSGMLASLAFVPTGLWLVPRALPGLGRATRWLTLLVLLSNFVVQSSMGVFYRATKPLVAPLLLALLLLALAEWRQPRFSARAAATAVFTLGLVISLLDRQGLFYLMCLALALGAAWLITRRGLSLLVGAVAACAVWLAYFRVLGPRLVHALNGYWPSGRFQRLHPMRLLASDPWLQSIDVLGDWTAVLLGNLPKALLAAVLAVLLASTALWAWRQRRSPRRVALAAACALAGVAAQVTMVAIMVERHPPVAWPGSRLWYYPLPYQAVAAFGALWALEAYTRRRTELRSHAVPLVLGALVLLNVLAWPELRETLNSDPPFAEQATNSAAFVRSFHGGLADPQLAGSDRIFYFECLSRFPRLAARARNQVGEVEGFLHSELREGRLAAWARSDAHLVAWTHPAGRYALTGSAWLRAGEKLTVFLGRGRPRLAGEIRRRAPEDGIERFRVVTDLGEGANAIQIVSALPEMDLPGRPRGSRAAYQLQLPVQVLPAAADSPPASQAAAQP